MFPSKYNSIFLHYNIKQCEEQSKYDLPQSNWTCFFWIDEGVWTHLLQLYDKMTNIQHHISYSTYSIVQII
jgi:hypothetical protein